MNDELFARVMAHVIEVGECWEWQGALKVSGTTPMLQWGGRTISVRRALLLAAGVRLGVRVATCRCGNELCVNPAHLEAITRAKLAKRSAVAAPLNVLRQSKLSARARERSKLTLEIVQAIRAAEGTQRQIAAAFGVCQATVSYIRSNRSWRDYTNPFAQLFGNK